MGLSTLIDRARKAGLDERTIVAAEQGDAGAQLNLATCYLNGGGVEQDPVEAVAWYRKAAEQGHEWAQVLLAVFYANGEGVPQDYVQAHKWSNLVASRSVGRVNDAAVLFRGSMEEKLTPDQIAEAQRLAREWDEMHPR